MVTNSAKRCHQIHRSHNLMENINYLNYIDTDFHQCRAEFLTHNQ